MNREAYTDHRTQMGTDMPRDSAFNEINQILDPSGRQECESMRRISPDMLRQVPRIQCADGFSMSVQASAFHYCKPRDSVGPWSRVEVGFPSEREDALMPYAEDPDNPTETVYGFVPVEVLSDVIAKHGGMSATPA